MSRSVHCWRLLRAGIASAVVLGTTAGLPPSLRAAEPHFQAPFPCREVWRGSTYAAAPHDNLAIDFDDPATGENDNRVVVAAADGVVIDNSQWPVNGQVTFSHPDGWVTTYAHLDNSLPRPVGAYVQGQVIGYVDATPNRKAVEPAGYAHLHYEVKQHGVLQQPKFGGQTYIVGTDVSSNNGCGPSDGFLDDISMVRGNTDRLRFFGLHGNAQSASFTMPINQSFAASPAGIEDHMVVGDFDNDGRVDDIALARPTRSGDTRVLVFPDGGRRGGTAWGGRFGIPLAGIGGRIAVADLDGG